MAESVHNGGRLSAKIGSGYVHQAWLQYFCNMYMSVGNSIFKIVRSFIEKQSKGTRYFTFSASF